MIKNIKIKQFLIVSFIIIIAIMSVLGGASVYFTRMLANQTIQFYESPHTVQLEVSEIKLLLSEIDSGVRGAMIYKNPSETQKATQEINAMVADMGARIAVVQDKFLGDPQILLNADAAVSEWLAALNELLATLEQQEYAKASTIFQLKYADTDAQLAVEVDQVFASSNTRTLEYYESAKRSKSISIVVIITTILVNIALCIAVLSIIIRSVTAPLAELTKAADSMSCGKLDLKIKFVGKNEFGQLAESIRKTIATLSGYVTNIDETLGRIAKNDMTATVDMDYIGDFVHIKTSLERITASLNGTMCRIEESAEQVTGGAEQISSGAQVLSQGATEQASSVEELLESVNAVSTEVQQNAANTAQTNRLTQSVGEQLAEGNRQMKALVDAISDINNSSSRIAKIIKTIEDIAFQTNILALNAAVEAARAGEAGKGFAVVADEVRSLAGKSAEAAKSTTELIGNSVKAVENGTRIASDTARTIEDVVSGAMQITEMLDKISAASDRQASKLSDISAGVKQVASVVEVNSASAQESAAASEELSGQAQLLKSLVAEFRLNRNGAALSWAQEES